MAVEFGVEPLWRVLRVPSDGGAGSSGVEPGGAVEAGAPSETQGSEAEPAAETPAAETGGGAGREPPPPTLSQGEEPKEDWRDKRIARLTAQLKGLREKVGQQPTSPSETPPQPPVGIPPEEVDRRVAEQLAIVDFNRRCDAAAQAGHSAYGAEAFNGRINNLRKLVDRDDPQANAAYNAMLMAALQTGEAPKVLYELGEDLNEANRILNLPPTDMAVAITRRALARPVSEVSGAPKPVTTVGGRGVSFEKISPDDPDRADSLSTDVWMRRREEQLAAKRAAR